jgi:hypothetical protein
MEGGEWIPIFGKIGVPILIFLPSISPLVISNYYIKSPCQGDVPLTFPLPFFFYNFPSSNKMHGYKGKHKEERSKDHKRRITEQINRYSRKRRGNNIGSLRKKIIKSGISSYLLQGSHIHYHRERINVNQSPSKSTYQKEDSNVDKISE